MNTCVRLSLVALLGMLCTARGEAQLCCPVSECLTPVVTYQTVNETREVTAYRIEYETVCDERQITCQRPVWETQIQKRRYTVARPVTETSEREERYTVLRPVWETRIRDCSYDRIRCVQETAEREERYTVLRPVLETHEREERYTVRRPIYETAYRTEQYTVMRPVVSSRTEYVDQGCYRDQLVYRAGPVRTRLTWQPGTYVTDPLSGRVGYKRAGLFWTPVQCGRYEVQRAWQPNLVAQEIRQTSYVPMLAQRQVPVQVCRYQEEQICRKIPYQVCRTVAEEHVRKVPYTVLRQVVERVEQKVPVKVCRMESHEQVRKIPVTTCRMVYEEREEEIPVRVCRMESVQQTIRVPRLVEKRIPLKYTCVVPQVVTCQMPATSACCVPLGCLTDGATTSVEISPSEETETRKPSEGQPTLAPRKKEADAADQTPAIPKDPAYGQPQGEQEPAPAEATQAVDEGEKQPDSQGGVHAPKSDPDN